MKFTNQSFANNGFTETYITASPSFSHDTPIDQQAQEIFSEIKKQLDTNNLIILQERLFATPQAIDHILPIRKKCYGNADDGVKPTCLAVPAGINGPLAGVLIHAVAGAAKPEILKLQNNPLGRVLRQNGSAYITLSALCDNQNNPAPQQSKTMLENAETLLKQVHADLYNVPRTWMWLGKILDWYDDFNAVRNQFFTERGLIGNGSVKMPASTGIGIGPANGQACTMDLVAIVDPKNPIKYLDAGGNQKSAFDYGSAFSRATQAKTPAGQTLFISGTASIDDSGKTTHLDDPKAQIQATIDNVRALLKGAGASDQNVLQAIVYSKTPEIEKLFCNQYADLTWPRITAVADVCRHDLLFEIEAVAAL